MYLGDFQGATDERRGGVSRFNVLSMFVYHYYVLKPLQVYHRSLLTDLHAVQVFFSLP